MKKEPHNDVLEGVDFHQPADLVVPVAVEAERPHPVLDNEEDGDNEKAHEVAGVDAMPETTDEERDEGPDEVK